MNSSMIRPRIAILASYPAWELANSPIERGNGHSCPWLVALSEIFESSHDFEVHWVILCKNIRKPIQLEQLGQHFHLLPRARQTIGLYSFYVHDRLVVARALKRISPDLVHAWGNEDCYGLCGSDFSGKKLLSIQGSMRTCVQTGTMPRFMRHQSLYEPFVVAAYNWVTTESPLAETWIRALSSKPRYIHFEYATEQRFFGIDRHQSPLPTCLYAGTDSPIKNVNFLIDVFSRPELSHIQLRLAGIMPDSRTNLPNNIVCLGRIGRNDVVRELASTWCLVHPSLADTGPTIVKEARVIGVPVILSDCCGSKQHVVENQSGFVVSPHDTEAFIRSVLAVTRDAKTSLSMGSVGVDECRHALSKETMYNTLKNIYSTILNS